MNLHFAWENNFNERRVLDKVQDMIRGTTIVVVVGYSFPFLNRKIDIEIFRILKQFSPKIKIYYQDPALNGQQLYTRFGLSKKTVIEHIIQTNSFHIPYEF